MVLIFAGTNFRESKINAFHQYESGGTFFIGFLIEYLAKLNAIILIIYSSRPFNVVCELQEFALRGSDSVELIPSF